MAFGTFRALTGAAPLKQFKIWLIQRNIVTFRALTGAAPLESTPVEAHLPPTVRFSRLGNIHVGQTTDI